MARFSPSRLLLVERSEPALYTVDRDLREAWPSLSIVPVVGDVGDRERMLSVFREHGVSVVAHAAAHKHVPLMETNATEAVKNNVLGSLTLGEVAGECGVEAFIFISTDKAVRPSSVMGATKRVAELVVEQIARGGPVTITHPDMKRYFMTIPEAAVLTLQAGAMGRGGEIFVLDMGEPVHILDLAKRMIEMSGYRRSGEIDILFTGVRPGEKLFEELQYSGESIDKRPCHPDEPRLAGRGRIRRGVAAGGSLGPRRRGRQDLGMTRTPKSLRMTRSFGPSLSPPNVRFWLCSEVGRHETRLLTLAGVPPILALVSIPAPDRPRGRTADPTATFGWP